MVILSKCAFTLFDQRGRYDQKSFRLTAEVSESRPIPSAQEAAI